MCVQFLVCVCVFSIFVSVCVSVHPVIVLSAELVLNCL